MTGLDSESWACAGCGAPMIGRRPAGDRCPECSPAPSGPFATEKQARDTPQVQAIFTAFRADPGAGRMDAANARMITEACDRAGVDLGAFDRRIIAWVAGYEPATCIVFAGLIDRAAARSPDRSPG